MAADPRITLYIRQQMDAGFRRQQIYDSLLEAGWYKEEIDEAFYEVANQAYSRLGPSPAQGESPGLDTKTGVQLAAGQPLSNLPEKPGFFWKLRNALFHPGRFFDAVKPEKGIMKPLAFFGVLSFIDFMITLAVLLLAPSLLQSFMNDPLLQQFFQYVILVSLISMLDPLSLLLNYVIIFAFTLLAAAAIHFFVYVLRGSKGFQQTYKALMYSSAPLIFLALVFPLYLLSFDYPFMVFPAIALIVIAASWSLLIAVKGLSKLHEISVLKAVVSLVIIPLIIGIALYFVAFMFLSSFFLGMFNPSAYLGAGGSATGFGELGLPSQWQYAYDGSFSVTLKNNAGTPITINSVTVNCGAEGSMVVLETLDPLSLESGGDITYSSGSERCALKEPGETYSVSVDVRYLQGGGLPKTASGTVTGRIKG